MTKDEVKKSETAQKAENENVSDEELAKSAGGLRKGGICDKNRIDD